MNNEPNKEQELTEQELKGIAGGVSGPCELLGKMRAGTIVEVEEPADTSVAPRRFDPAQPGRAFVRSVP